MSLWTWKCPIKGCNGHGKQPLNHRRARCYAKLHGKRIHGDRKIEPIMERIDKNGEMRSNKGKVM